MRNFLLKKVGGAVFRGVRFLGTILYLWFRVWKWNFFEGGARSWIGIFSKTTIPSELREEGLRGIVHFLHPSPLPPSSSSPYMSTHWTAWTVRLRNMVRTITANFIVFMLRSWNAFSLLWTVKAYCYFYCLCFGFLSNDRSSYIIVVVCIVIRGGRVSW